MTVEGGIRTPKERTFTSWGSFPGTMLSIISRGMMTRGFEQGLPFDSITCSQIRQVAPGMPSMLKNSSGCEGWMLMRSYMGEFP